MSDEDIRNKTTSRPLKQKKDPLRRTVSTTITAIPPPLMKVRAEIVDSKNDPRRASAEFPQVVIKDKKDSKPPTVPGTPRAIASRMVTIRDELRQLKIQLESLSLRGDRKSAAAMYAKLDSRIQELIEEIRKLKK